MISWQTALTLRVFIGNIIVPVMIKKQAGRVDANARFLLQFVIAALISSMLFLFWSEEFDPLVLGASALLGALTVSGTFFQWKALAISGAKTSVLAFMDDVIAMGLSASVLDEWRKITKLALLGVVCCGLSIVGFVSRALGKKETATEKTPLRFFVFVGIYSVIWGVSFFLQRVFAMKSFGMMNLVGGWYIGGAVAAFVLTRYLSKEKNIYKKVASLKKGDVGAIALLAALIVCAMCLQYVIFHAVIQFATMPVLMVGEMIIQATIFLIVFPKERRQFDRYEVGASILAFVGTFLIMFFQS